MERVLEILQGLKPDVDFRECRGLVEEGVLDSFDIVSLFAACEDAFGIAIPPTEITEENLNSAESIWAMVQKYL